MLEEQARVRARIDAALEPHGWKLGKVRPRIRICAVGYMLVRLDGTKEIEAVYPLDLILSVSRLNERALELALVQRAVAENVRDGRA